MRPQACLRRGRRLVGILALTAVAASGVVAPTAAAGKPKQKMPVLSPRAGELYRSHPVPLKVRAHRHDEVVARLNGTRVADELELDRANATNERRAGLSPNHGLRHGKNTLRVRVKKFHGGVRERTVRFRVAKDDPLAAAGRDRAWAPRARLRLNGRKSRAHPGAREKRLRYRWNVVSAPKGSRRALREDTARRGLLRKPRSSRPVLRTSIAGTYRLHLEVAAQGRRIGGDRIAVTADPRPALELETMARDANGRWGIRVGEEFHPAKPGAWLQVVVVDRSYGTLRSNKSYDCPNPVAAVKQCVATVKRDLDALGKGALVIASNQPEKGGTTAAPHGVPESLSAALNVPNSPLPADAGLVRGTYSAVGPIGGPSFGNAAAANEPGAGAIEGLLIRNDRLNYAFSSGDRVTFDTQAPGSSETVNVIRVGDTNFRAEVSDPGGFHVVWVDRQTLQGESRWFPTGHTGDVASSDARIDALRRFLAGAASNEQAIVFIASRGVPLLEVHGGNKALYNNVVETANLIQRLGGTRTPFYKLIDNGLYQNAEYYPYHSYTLAGSRSDVGEGRVGQVRGAPYPDSTANQAPLSGTLIRSTDDYGFAIGQTWSEHQAPLGPHPPRTDPGQNLIDAAHRSGEPWPDTGDAGRTAAIRWIGHEVGLTDGPSDDPRPQYYSNFEDTDWDAVRNDVERLQPAELPVNVTEIDFEWAQRQLSDEIRWLIKTRDFVDTLASPYKQIGFKSWADMQSIAAQINEKVQAAPHDKTVMVLEAVFDGARRAGEVLPEPAGEVASLLNTVYDTGLRIAEISAGDDEAGRSFETSVAKAASDLANRLTDAENALNGLGKVIAGDYAKLRTVGACRLKDVERCPTNPDDWAIGGDLKTHMGWGLRFTLRNHFYTTILPAKYTLWSIPHRRNVACCADARHWLGERAIGRPIFPFANVPDSAQFASPWCRSLHDHELDEWQVRALGFFSDSQMRVPDRSVTDPIFAPVDSDKFPEGGLGNDKEAFYLRYFAGAPIDKVPGAFRMFWRGGPHNQNPVHWKPTCFDG